MKTAVPASRAASKGNSTPNAPALEKPAVHAKYPTPPASDHRVDRILFGMRKGPESVPRARIDPGRGNYEKQANQFAAPVVQETEATSGRVSDEAIQVADARTDESKVTAQSRQGVVEGPAAHLNGVRLHNAAMASRSIRRMKAQWFTPPPWHAGAVRPALLQDRPLPFRNSTGLPDTLKASVESLSGVSLDDVNVHYNSFRPAQLNALAYTQGSEIHVGPGQQQHLPHEAWHVVQQAQGRVAPTIQKKGGVPVNDDEGLEREADLMGAKSAAEGKLLRPGPKKVLQGKSAPVQMEDGDGKDVVADLTRPDWQAPGKRETNKGKQAITGQELKTLLRGAAIAAWNTFAYHATKSANVSSITTEGLDPRRGGTGAAAGNATFQEHSRGHVHYTRSRGLAEDYQRHFEGGAPFGRRDPSPGPAEVLQVAIHRDVATGEEADPDTPKYDRAFRTTEKIPGKYMRRTGPVPLPAPREREGKKGRGKKGHAEPLVPGANNAAWVDHIQRTFSETSALLSNMPPSATSVLYDVMKRGLDVDTVLQTVKQALRSMSTDALLDYTKEDTAANPRLNQGRMDPTGNLLPLKPK